MTILRNHVSRKQNYFKYLNAFINIEVNLFNLF